MPRLVLEARRVAASLAHGIHGRRRAGVGETFWQFRPFVAGEAAQRIDWRRSGRDDRLYVREREWETAQTRLALDRPLRLHGLRLRPGPGAEDRARARARPRARPTPSWKAGERVGLLGLMPPRATRRIAEKMAAGAGRRPRLASTTTCRPRAPIAPLDEGDPDQRLPVARARRSPRRSRASRRAARAAIS